MLEITRYGVWPDNHVACVRPEPKGDWVRFTDHQQAVERLERELKGMQDIVRKAYALQTAHTRLRGLVREIKEEFDGCTHECERCGESDPMTTFDIYKTVCEAAAIGDTLPREGGAQVKQHPAFDQYGEHRGF